MLNGKNILIISPEAWGVNYVSKHHYALELAKNNYIYFLNPPTKNFYLSRIDLNLTIVDYKPKFRGLAKLPRIISAFCTRYELLVLEKNIGCSFDIIWNFDSSRFFSLSRIEGKLKIAHLVDLNQNIQRDQLALTSDICLCTTNFIFKKLIIFNTKTFNIGHGVKLDNLNSILNSHEKFEIADDYKLKAAYVGNLSIKYLDWKTLYQLVKQNPKTAFYFIGPTGESNLSKSHNKNPILTSIQTLPNAFFIGAKHSKKIISYIKEMDILLIVYKVQGFKKQLANPHKMLEYLSSGKVIVSSWTDEYKNKSNLVEMVKTNDELPSRFREVVNDLRFFNSQQKQKERKEFALKNTYKIKLQQIESLIERHVGY